METGPQAVAALNKNQTINKKDGHNLSRKQLINRLNSINFRDETILVNLRHKRFGNILTLSAFPEPCTDTTLSCVWTNPESVPSRLDDYSCSNFLLNDGKFSYAVIPQTLELGKNGARFALPVIGRRTATRLTRRHPGHKVNAQFIQNGCIFNGQLVDFSSRSMRLDLVLEEGQSARWLNPEQAAELILARDGEAIYSGSCRIIREKQRGAQLHTLVIEPNKPDVSRFRNSEFRSSRHQFVPAPTASFRHPLTGRLTNLLTRNISGTGFAVDEESAESLMLPGLVIPEMKLLLTNSFSIRCRAQVVYRNPTGQADSGKTRFGIAFLDMSPEDHLQLLSLVQRAENEKAHLSQVVDSDRLLDFFFNAGFIYPEKYAAVAREKNALKATYEKLYTECPSIARHFIHQDNDRIYAHMAAIRFYQNAWMVHHHVANGEKSTRAGLDVLNQTTRWLNDSRYIPSIHLDYFFCYFRDTNRFPMRLFGGIFNGINDSSICSLDPFAYYYHHLKPDTDWNLEQPWSLQKATAEDLREIGFYYEGISGGLMTQALDLQPESLADAAIDDVYRQHGFFRARHIFALKDDIRLKALFVVNIADFGLNLSELTNAVQVIIPDPDELPSQLLDLILSLLCLKFKKSYLPILLFPDTAAEHYDIAIEKKYMLWIFNSARMDHFFQQLKKMTRSIGH